MKKQLVGREIKSHSTLNKYQYQATAITSISIFYNFTGAESSCTIKDRLKKNKIKEKKIEEKKRWREGVHFVRSSITNKICFVRFFSSCPSIHYAYLILPSASSLITILHLLHPVSSTNFPLSAVWTSWRKSWAT